MTNSPSLLARLSLAVAAATALVFSAPINAGLIGADSISMAKKFPKRDKDPKEGELLVKFKDGVPQAVRDGKHAQEGNVKIRELKRSGIHQVAISPDQTVEQAVARYQADANVAFAEPNYIVRAQAVPNEPAFANLMWALNNTGLHNNGLLVTTPGADIRALQAWDITTGSQDLVVMVIDSGIDYTHGDLAANMWVNPGEIPGNGIDDDGNGYIDDVNGIDVVNNDSNPIDDQGHGTHVAGTIGAVGNNNLGVVGVAWNVKLVACKMLDANGEGTIESAVQCLEYARTLKQRGVNIVATNNSYGGMALPSQTLNDALDAQRAADILFIAAAGNTFPQGENNDVVDFYPADARRPNVISVAATDYHDALAGFSHFGRRSVHLGAPGVQITSTTPFNEYRPSDGTSMASPHVAGVSVLLKAQNPARTWSAIRNLTLAGGDVKPSTTGKTISGRRLNAFGALSCANRPLFSVVELPAAFTVNQPATVSALSINCAAPVGPVTATTSSGQTFTLADDGVAPDLVAGDGEFTATWTPSQPFAYIDFVSPSGSDRVEVQDLTVAGVSGPASAARGTPITVVATVSNPSATAVPASTLNLYLSVDGVITAADTLLGSVAVLALAGGQQQAVSASFGVPATLAGGNYFIGAVVDPDNLIDEGNEQNNAATGNIIAVSAVAVDLSVAALTGPSTAFTGDPISVSATVSNVGSSQAPASTLALYLSADNLITSTDVPLGTVAIGALAGGASQSVTASLPVPVTLPPGSYFIGAIADGANEVNETNEGNNTRASAARLTTTTRNINMALSAVTGPGSAKDGATVTFSATAVNQGTVASPASTVRWYLSTDNVITTSDFPVGSVAVAALGAGKSALVSANIPVPSNVPAGTYYVGAIVDPDNTLAETNNGDNARAGGLLAVQYSVDLQVTALAAPASGVTGGNYTFNATLKNAGLAASGKPVRVDFFLSSDNTIDPSTDPLIASSTVPALAAGASVQVTATAALRTGVKSGAYFIGAVVDPANAIAESNKGNNRVRGNAVNVTYGPDLVIASVSGPASVTRGQSFTFNATLTNQGSGAIGAATDQDVITGGKSSSIRVGIYLSDNPNITAKDKRVGSIVVNAINPGQSIPLSIIGLIPSELKTGPWYVGAIADHEGSVRESDKMNNARSGNVTTVR
jgi:subtilisin family serine protease/subtilase family serine protease